VTFYESVGEGELVLILNVEPTLSDLHPFHAVSYFPAMSGHDGFLECELFLLAQDRASCVASINHLAQCNLCDAFVSFLGGSTNRRGSK